MVLTEEQLEAAEQQILDRLEHVENPYHPVQLIRDLESEQTSEYVLRAAIWYLIDRNEIELTSNRLLQRLHHLDNLSTVAMSR